MFFKHFVSKNQLPGLSIIGTLVEKGLVLGIAGTVNMESTKLISIILSFKCVKYFCNAIESFITSPDILVVNKNKILVLGQLHLEATVRRCFSKYVFLKTLQIHRKTPVLESLFKKVAGLT